MTCILLWDWRCKGPWQCTVVWECGKLKAAESPRSVSECVCTSRLAVVKVICPHCFSGKIRNIPHLAARRQVKVMRTGSDTQFSSSRRLPGYGQSSLAIHSPVNHGTCIAYQDYIALQLILAQIVSILMHSKNKDMHDTNKKYILLCLLTYNIFATH